MCPKQTGGSVGCVPVCGGARARQSNSLTEKVLKIGENRIFQNRKSNKLSLLPVPNSRNKTNSSSQNRNSGHLKKGFEGNPKI